MASAISCNIHIEKDDSQFEIYKQGSGQHVLTLVPFTAHVFMERVQLLILRDQLTAFLEQDQ